MYNTGFQLTWDMGSPGSVIVDLLIMSRLNESSLAPPSLRFIRHSLHDPRVQLHHVSRTHSTTRDFSGKWQQVQTVAVVNECCHLLWFGYILVRLGRIFFGLRSENLSGLPLNTYSPRWIGQTSPLRQPPANRVNPLYMYVLLRKKAKFPHTGLGSFSWLRDRPVR